MDDPSTPAVAVIALAPVLVCTFEHPDDHGTSGGDPEVALNVGGQGPWVARAVAALGAEAILVVPLGGDTGRAAGHLLSEAPYAVRDVPTQAATACYVEERRGGERSCIREARAGRFGEREIDDLYSAALSAAMDADVCVITGSPWGDHVDSSLLTRLTADLGTFGRTTVADLSGDQLDAALTGGVDWLKIADDELAGADDPGLVDDEDSLWERALDLARAHGRERSVVVSRAERPTLVVADGTCYTVSALGLSTVDSRGSGDAMTAALATGLAAQLPVDELLRRAAAAGAANAVHKGSATPDADLVERLAEEIEVSEVTGVGGGS